MHLDAQVKGGFVVPQSAQNTGERLRLERDRLGWSQQQAATAVGIRREMWAKYEAGAEPGAKTLTAMAEAGVDVMYVLTGRRAFVPAAPVVPEHRALIADYDACSPRDQAALRRTAAAMALGEARSAESTKPQKVDIYIENVAGTVSKKLKQRETNVNLGKRKK